jgi:4-hydroxybenzoyl-CoA thioesterase
VSTANKTINRKKITIEWGDCDPAQIVHFPRYFNYFDACTTALFKKAGLEKVKMLETYKVAGIPMVELRTTFMRPSRFSDIVVIESEITEFRRSSFYIRHRLYNHGVLSVECIETRVWAIHPDGDETRLESRPVPPEVIARFMGTGGVRKQSATSPAKKK